MKNAVTMGLLLVAMAAGADTLPPRDRLNLSASASVDVTRDVLGVTFSTTKEGSDAASVQSALKQALDAALSEARKIAKPGQVDVQTGNFSLYPRYVTKNGNNTISGWQGSAELLVEGKDVAAIAQLTGRISSMSIFQVGYSLSKDLRDKVEGDVVAQAITRYKARAADYARQFGYASYQIGEVSVNTSDSGPMQKPLMQTRARAMSATVADESLPVEAGKATVSVSVTGAVQLTK